MNINFSVMSYGVNIYVQLSEVLLFSILKVKYLPCKRSGLWNAIYFNY